MDEYIKKAHNYHGTHRFEMSYEKKIKILKYKPEICKPPLVFSMGIQHVDESINNVSADFNSLNCDLLFKG